MVTAKRRMILIVVANLFFILFDLLFECVRKTAIPLNYPLPPEEK